jgi:hypothetical protein
MDLISSGGSLSSYLKESKRYEAMLPILSCLTIAKKLNKHA